MDLKTGLGATLSVLENASSHADNDVYNNFLSSRGVIDVNLQDKLSEIMNELEELSDEHMSEKEISLMAITTDVLKKFLTHLNEQEQLTKEAFSIEVMLRQTVAQLDADNKELRGTKDELHLENIKLKLTNCLLISTLNSIKKSGVLEY